MRRLSPSSAALAALALFASVIAPARPARATQVEALDLRTLVREAAHVVVATVVRLDAHRDDLDRIVTDATIRIDERLHGAAREGDALVVRRLGGVVGDVGLHVEGEAALAPGERVLLFARVVGRERVLRPIGMSQGVMRIERQAGAELVMPGGEGLALVQRGADGQLRPAPGPILEPTGVDALLAQVRALVAELHGGR